MKPSTIKLLYVEDNKDQQKVLRSFVKGKGLPYEITTADSVQQAKKLIAEETFDVIIADYFLGNGTAIDILGMQNSAPVIVVTSGTDEKQAIQAMKAGAYDYLLKEREGYLKVLPLAVENAIKHRVERDQLSMFSQAVMSIRESIFISDSEERIIFVNRAFCKTYGYTEKEILGKHTSLLWKISPEDPHKKRLPQVVSGTRIYNIRKDGEIFPVYLSRSVIRYGGSESSAVIGVSRDISELKQAKEEYQEFQQRFRQLAESIHGVFWLYDLHEDRVIYASPAYQRVYGVNNEDIFRSRQAFLRLIDEDDLERIAAVYHRRHQGTFNEEFRICRADGTLRWIHERTFPVQDQLGRVCRVSGIAEDITDKKHSEEANVRLASFPELSPNPIVEIDSSGKVLYLNTCAKELLPGLEEQGNKHPFLQDWERVVRQLSLEAKQTYVREILVEKSWYNQVFHYVDVAQAIRIYALDITEEKQLETQMLQRQKLESIGALAAGIAHEINTPIQYVGDNTRFLQTEFARVSGLIEKYIELVKAAKADAVQGQLLEEIETREQDIELDYLIDEIPKAIEQSLGGIKRVARIVQSMREFSHMGVTEKVPTDLNQALEDTVVVATNEWKYVADVETDLEQSLPNIPCFPGDLNQVLLNLVINAAYAIGEAIGPDGREKGKITVSTRQVGTVVEIRIADTGTGIPEDIHSKIFDPFFTTKGIGQGTGQGLAIAHQVIVKKHGGAITFDTEMGKGTTFIIRLPMVGNVIF